MEDEMGKTRSANGEIRKEYTVFVGNARVKRELCKLGESEKEVLKWSLGKRVPECRGSVAVPGQGTPRPLGYT
jgi:hypothetical protein